MSAETETALVELRYRQALLSELRRRNELNPVRVWVAERLVLMALSWLWDAQEREEDQKAYEWVDKVMAMSIPPDPLAEFE